MDQDPGGVRASARVTSQANILPLSRPYKAPARKRSVKSFATVEQAIAKLRPALPVHCLRPQVVEAKARWFLHHFPGEVLFAVKTNPDPIVLEAAYAAGVRHFDVASLAEIEQIHSRFPEAMLHFMHPVKSREAISKAYYFYGIRHFSLDSHEELEKILDVTCHADDLSLSVRLSIPNDKAAYSLSGKFGISLESAPMLMQATRKVAHKFGICFHVGSQCMDPEAYATTVGYVRDLLTSTDVRLDMLDVGGGFPSIYPDKIPPKMRRYMQAIKQAITTLPIDESCQILCEPGRALVAEAGSLVARVELRKGNALYLNDGVYGSLFDAGEPRFIFPVRAVRPGHTFDEEMQPFVFYGPTCDSCDAMQGPFMLPADIQEGDWIEIGQMGAYGAPMRTKFNGFYSDAMVKVVDQPLMEMEME